MIPTIKKQFQNIIISTGNIINTKLTRKSNEELYDSLRLTLQSDQGAEHVQVNIDEINGQVQRATDKLTEKLTENDRSEISIGAKIFLNKNSSVFIDQAIESVLDILDVKHVDNLVLAYHPNAEVVATPTTPTPKTPCGEGGGGGGSDSNSSGLNFNVRNWNSRNGTDGIEDLKKLWTKLEQFAQQNQVLQLGIADLDADTLSQLYTTAQVQPTIAQVNLSSCCVVPPELQEFCTKNDIQLLTHGDPELLLPDEELRTLIPDYTVDWTLRYQVHVRCRGVLTAKGYIVGASRLTAPTA